MRRRSLLALAGAAGLTVSILPARALLPVLPRRPPATAEAALGWIRHAEGRYTLWLPRTEMGQHIATTLQQVACAELGVGWDRVQVRLPATCDIPRVKATVGSDSVREFVLPLAQACATLREALAAGATAGVLQPVLRPAGALRALQPGALRALGPVPLVHGQSIVRGEPLYAADMRVPGMLYGRVLRAEASPELASQLRRLDEDAARAVPGFVALVRNAALRQGRAEGLGIVARTPGALDRIAAALAPQWEVQGGFDAAAVDSLLDVDARLRRGRLPHVLADDAGLDAGAAWDVDLRLDVPFAAHAGIEPRAALAQWQSGAGGPALRLWAGTQDPFFVRDVVARALGLDADAVQLQTCRVGGAFGSRTLCTVELEAAVLARAVQGAVQLQWTRTQELRQGFHRPASSHRVRARLGPDGQLHSWWHAFVSGHILFTNAAMPPWMQSVSRLVGDAGVARGADMPYRAQARRVEFDLARLPVLAGPWRGLGAGPNHLAIELAMDALAERAGADPLAFRLAHVQDARLAEVLRRVARSSGWQAPLAPAPAGWRGGRGLACGIYKQHSYAATVAEVQVEEASGAVRVVRLWCAHDCGLVLQADQVRAQCEGNLVWGLGMVLVEGLAVGEGTVAARNFGDAPVPRLHEVPPMALELVAHAAPPGGAGETAIVAAAGAVANAVAAATGLRVRQLPLRADALLRHLQAAG
jgi:isoquinoline 1-oxidoreductase beta subunit